MTKNYCCPICEGKIDLEHYAFVQEVLGDPAKMRGWMDKTYTIDIWRKEHDQNYERNKSHSKDQGHAPRFESRPIGGDLKRMIAKQDGWYRHGDVIIRPITEDAYKSMVSSQVKKVGSTIAYGEVTGHHHTLANNKAQLLMDPKTRVVTAFKTEQTTKLNHQEHDTINIPKGYYTVSFEREQQPLEQTARQVYD